MTLTQSSVKIEPLEQLVGQVRGVQATRLVADEQGQIAEVHVVGTPDRSAKAIVRDIESILFVRGGVRVNHRKISLVQLPEAALAAGARVQLVGVAPGEPPGSLTATLAVGERRMMGTAGGESDVPGEQIAARATVAALGEIIGTQGRFQVEQVERHRFGTLDVCLAHVSLSVDETLETLLGISVVREGPEAAAARAVLDAVNRRLPGLLGGQQR